MQDARHEEVEGEGNEEGVKRRSGALRLKRAQEMLPDSLLEFSLPVAPRSRVDYSLPAPSSDWRNNASASARAKTG